MGVVALDRSGKDKSMYLPNTVLRVALAVILILFSACIDDDGDTLVASPDDTESPEGTETDDGALGDTDEPEPEVPAPDPELDPFVSALDRVDFWSDGSRIELLAYDAHDQLIGTLALQYHEVGTAQFVAAFDDGTALVDIDGITFTDRHADLPELVIAHRIEAIQLEIDSGAQQGWAWCGAAVIATIATCWSPVFNAWMCGTSAFLTTCYCLDKLADKYEWLHDEC